MEGQEIKQEIIKHCQRAETNYQNDRNFIGHVMRHNQCIINITEGKINGKRGRGRALSSTNPENIKKAIVCTKL